MKRIIMFSIALSLLSISNASAQVFVRIRPLAPPVIVVRPPCPTPRHVWIPGEWRWNKRHGEYNWVEGHWIEPRHGKMWIEGHWIDGTEGSKWMPGHWARRR